MAKKKFVLDSPQTEVVATEYTVKEVFVYSTEVTYVLVSPEGENVHMVVPIVDLSPPEEAALRLLQNTAIRLVPARLGLSGTEVDE